MPVGAARKRWGRFAKPAAGFSRDVCNFQLPEVRNLRLPLTNPADPDDIEQSRGQVVRGLREHVAILRLRVGPPHPHRV